MVRVAVWQGKPAEGNTPKNSLTQFEEILEACKEETDILVLPEMFFGGYVLGGDLASRRMTGRDLQKATQLSRRKDIGVIFGCLEQVDDKFYSTGIAVDRDGKVLLRQRKRHLFGPDEEKALTAGTDAGHLITMSGLEVGLLVGTDVEHCDEAYGLSAEGCNLIVTPTAKVRPTDDCNELVMRARALENLCYVVYANWTSFDQHDGTLFNGNSMCSAPDGDVLLKFNPQDPDGIKYVDIPLPPRKPGSTRVGYY